MPLVHPFYHFSSEDFFHICRANPAFKRKRPPCCLIEHTFQPVDSLVVQRPLIQLLVTAHPDKLCQAVERQRLALLRASGWGGRHRTSSSCIRRRSGLR